MQDIEKLLVTFDLSGNSHKDLVDAGRIVVPMLDKVLEKFYAHATSDPDIKRFFPEDSVVDHARNAQKRHWGLLLTGDFPESYLESAERIGRTHFRIQLPFQHYLSAYSRATSHIQSLLIESARGLSGAGRKRRMVGMLGALTRAFALDMQLVIDGYFTAQQEEQTIAFDHLGQGITRIAQRDLSKAIPAPAESDYPKRFNGLRETFNFSLDGLREVINSIQETVDDITRSADEIASASEDLSVRTESQAATVEETAAAMEEITETQKQATEAALQTNALMQETRSRAEQSMMVVEGAIQKMRDIEASSDKISSIIGVIDEIAFQTNLLALNAGVEAARAGTAGQGFAVVATEVRNLAQRASTSAKEIKGLISGSSEHVKSGVTLVSETGETLRGIVEGISKASNLVGDISASANEQSTGISEINTSVSQIDISTQKNAAMVEETTAAIMSMRNNVNDLTKVVGSFSLAKAGSGQGSLGHGNSESARKTA